MNNKEIQQLAINNHNLIYSYIHKHHLELNEYYDVCAIGLMKASKHYDKNKGIKFSTYAWSCMDNEMKNTHKAKTAFKRKIEEFEIDITETEYLLTDYKKSNVANDVSLFVDLENALSKIKPKYRDIMLLKIQGYTLKEIGDFLNISRQTASKRIERGRSELKKWLQ